MASPAARYTAATCSTRAADASESTAETGFARPRRASDQPPSRGRNIDQNSRHIKSASPALVAGSVRRTTLTTASQAATDAAWLHTPVISQAPHTPSATSTAPPHHGASDRNASDHFDHVA